MGTLNDKEIIGVLEEQAAILIKATSALVEFMSNYKVDGESKSKIIKDLEHEGDIITHKLFTILDKTFVTPLDPEDISRLTSAIDEVLDATEGVANRFVLFMMREPTPYMVELAKLLLSASPRSSAVGNANKKLKRAQVT